SSLPMHYLPVNDLPGLFCKRCYRFVPILSFSRREKGRTESIMTSHEIIGKQNHFRTVSYIDIK
ncbi:MAG: hypothetical protein ABW170_18265, partial [Candidatus Thiodiazotropha sp. L084R]